LPSTASAYRYGICRCALKRPEAYSTGRNVTKCIVCDIAGYVFEIER
jgi:hypothetical protein